MRKLRFGKMAYIKVYISLLVVTAEFLGQES